MNNNIVSVSPKEVLQVESCLLKNNEVNGGICSFTLKCIDRLVRHITGAHSESFTVTICKEQKRETNRSCGISSKVPTRTVPTRPLTRRFYQSQAFPHDHIFTLKYFLPARLLSPLLLISKIFLGAGFKRRREPKGPTRPGSDWLRLWLFKYGFPGDLDFAWANCSAGCTWFQDTYLIQPPCPRNCSPLCEPEVYLKEGGANNCNPKSEGLCAWNSAQRSSP